MTSTFDISNPAASAFAKHLWISGSDGLLCLVIRYIHESNPPLQSIYDVGSTSTMMNGKRKGKANGPIFGVTAHSVPSSETTHPTCLTVVIALSDAPCRLKVYVTEKRWRFISYSSGRRDSKRHG